VKITDASFVKADAKWRTFYTLFSLLRRSNIERGGFTSMNKQRFVITPGKKVKLKDYDPSDTGSWRDEREAATKIRRDCEALAGLQDKLLARESHALLLIFQGMDGAGKDGTIKHVMSSVDPQGCEVAMFSKPSETELKHDYLWRFIRRLPERGKIGIFNRSYYEEVLASRIHPERLAEQNLPIALRRSKNIWRQRFAHINNFEQYLAENGIIVMKFFLHISKEKQRERLLERLDLPEKKWKFSANDIEERGHWNEYQRAFEDVLTRTSTKYAPWHVVPADQRWFSALVVADLVVAQLKSMRLSYPPTSGDERERAEARKALESEG
jgi:PPK2 family polyphosphate:nucleotide phosphotransferase